MIFDTFLLFLFGGVAVFASNIEWRRSARLAAIPSSSCLIGFTSRFWLLTNGMRVSYAHALLIVAVIVVVCIVKWCSRSSWWLVCVVCVAGYTLEHIASDAVQIVAVLLVGVDNFHAFLELPGMVILQWCIYLAVYVVAWLTVGRRLRINEEILRHRASWVLICSAMLMMLVFASSYSVRGVSAAAAARIYLYDMGCTTFCLAVLMLLTMNDRLKISLATERRIDRQRQKHYEISQANRDVINMKAHDIRKNIESMYAQGMLQGSPKSVKIIQDGLRIYDSLFDTGNAALDAVLNEKSLFCESHGITLTCLADGRTLDFLETADVYSLFGNILDNAIEAVRQLDDASKRAITLDVRSVGSVLKIEERNFYNGDLRFRDGLPVSTKNDARYHGFGTQSMRYVVYQYGGRMSLETEDGVFRVSIGIPLPTKDSRD